MTESLVLPYRYRARLDRIVDADTLDMTVDLGFRTTRKTRFRVAGIDAWEVRGEEREKGLEASRFVAGWAKTADVDGWPFIIDSHRDSTGKYGRWLADVWRAVDGAHLATDLVARGHAQHVIY